MMRICLQCRKPFSADEADPDNAASAGSWCCSVRCATRFRMKYQEVPVNTAETEGGDVKTEAQKAREELRRMEAPQLNAQIVGQPDPDEEGDDLDDMFELMHVLTRYATRQVLGSRARKMVLDLMDTVLGVAHGLQDEIDQGHDDDGGDDVDPSDPAVLPARGSWQHGGPT